MSTESRYQGTEIAVIGLACRFPGAPDLETYWSNLARGVESIRFFTDQELRDAGVPEEVLRDPQYVKARAVLEGVELFDAEFFDFTPRDAQITDPQQRLFLECAWESLEHAGYDPKTCGSSIGVFGGTGMNNYRFNLLSDPSVMGSVSGVQLELANEKDYTASRVSYKLDLRGPSVTVQSGCSTSLVALHLAAQSLLNHECDMALAGGSSVTLPQAEGYFHYEGGTASPDGHCRAFDVRARGTVNGSGAGMVLIKRLEDALADGDKIHAILKASAINNDGADKVGYTAPSVSGQARVIREALEMAELDPRDISYVEAHGTGTPLGDQVEIAALKRAFGAVGEDRPWCGIGSVKTNFGHLNAAAGMAGLIKTVLMLQHRQMPPSLHFEEPNPQLGLSESPFYVNRSLQEWPSEGGIRRAGVSSFTLGGTNAHVVVEEAPAPSPSPPPEQGPHLLVLSARTRSALERATTNLAAHLKGHRDLRLEDVAYTLQTGRRAFSQRRTVIARDSAEAAAALECLEAQRVATRERDPEEPAVCFLFPGQGTRLDGMSRRLYRKEAFFRRQFDRSAEILQPHLGLDIRRLLDPEDSAEAVAHLAHTRYAQAFLFSFELALAQLWIHWGVRPEAMLGHSLGELVAACLAGVFREQEALVLVAERGRLMEELAPGAMLAVALSEADLDTRLRPGLELAAVNGPRSVVVCGPLPEIAALETELAGEEISSRRLAVNRAFHSTMVEPLIEPFCDLVAGLELRAPKIPFLSNLTGTWITEEQATEPSYWGRQLRSPVRFAAGLEELWRKPQRILLQVGSGQTLSRLARRHPEWEPGRVVLSSFDRGSEAGEGLSPRTLGELWRIGVEIDWATFHDGSERRRIPLPTYPFERESYWIEKKTSAGPPPVEPPVSVETDSWLYLPVWKNAAPLPEPAKGGGPWLAFVDRHGLGDAAAALLEKRGEVVVRVRSGAQMRRVAENAFELRPDQRADYVALLETLRSESRIPRRILHLWSVSATQPEPLTKQLSERFLEMGFFSLLNLGQAIGEIGLEQSVRLAVVSNGVHRISGETVLWPEKATLLGPCLVLPRELPNLICKSIDVVPPAQGGWQQERLAAALLAEVESAAEETVVAYRDHTRWLRTCEPLEQRETVAQPSCLKSKMVVLITGGLHGIGLQVARELAQAVRARLILTGRAPLPARGDGESSPFQELEDLGGEVLACGGIDVADEAAMTGVLDRARQRFGELDAVIHAEELQGEGLAQFKTAEEAARVLSPKVGGTRVLERLTDGCDLDLLVLFSSTFSLTGGLGLVDFCAANAFLDAYAQAVSPRRKGATLVLNWSPWRSSGKTGGSGAVTAHLRRIREQSGLSWEEGGKLLRQALETSTPQLIVSRQDFRSALRGLSSLTSDSFQQVREPSSADPADSDRRLTATPYVEPANEVERTIAELMGELFGVDRIGVNDDFFELGGDSLLAVQVINRLRRIFLFDLPMSSLFEEPTVKGLARQVAEAQIDTLEQSEEFEGLLTEIEGLSYDEIQAALVDELQSQGQDNE